MFPLLLQRCISSVHGQQPLYNGCVRCMSKALRQLSTDAVKHPALASPECTSDCSSSGGEQDGSVRRYREPWLPHMSFYVAYEWSLVDPRQAARSSSSTNMSSSIPPQLVSVPQQQGTCTLQRATPFSNIDRAQAAAQGSSVWRTHRSALHHNSVQQQHMHSTTAPHASQIDYDNNADSDAEGLSAAAAAAAEEEASTQSAAAGSSNRPTSAAALVSKPAMGFPDLRPQFDLVPRHPQQHMDSRTQQLPAHDWQLQHQPWPQQMRQQQQRQQQEQLQEYPVFACHLAAEINFADFIAKNVLHIKDKFPLKDNVVILAAVEGDDVVFMGERSNQPQPHEQIFVIYRHGSVIFFNMRQRSIDRWLERLRPFVGRGTSPPGSHRQDETKLVIDSRLDSWSRLEPDKIVVQTLDAANARVISNVLGQSVALDYYNQKVDLAIQQFTPYLTKVAELGHSSDINSKELMKLIADNSLLYTDVVSKIGLLDISQTAWTQDKYHDLWTALRKDYELDRRFDAINRKLGPMIENAKFLLDIRAEQKSADAEKIIIYLIMLEVLVSIVGFWL